jgi:hypothetical protein
MQAEEARDPQLEQQSQEYIAAKTSIRHGQIAGLELVDEFPQ